MHNSYEHEHRLILSLQQFSYKIYYCPLATSSGGQELPKTKQKDEYKFSLKNGFALSFRMLLCHTSGTLALDSLPTIAQLPSR